MTKYQANWIFNFILKLAVIVCLSVLAFSLIIGTGPLTALLRSSVAFTTFAFLGWATSLVWEVPPTEEKPERKATAKQPAQTEGSPDADAYDDGPEA